eukprot:gene15554-15701_t
MRSASMRATSALTGTPSSAATRRNQSQNAGSRLIEKSVNTCLCPGIVARVIGHDCAALRLQRDADGRTDAPCSARNNRHSRHVVTFLPDRSNGPFRQLW